MVSVTNIRYANSSICHFKHFLKIIAPLLTYIGKNDYFSYFSARSKVAVLRRTLTDWIELYGTALSANKINMIDFHRSLQHQCLLTKCRRVSVKHDIPCKRAFVGLVLLHNALGSTSHWTLSVLICGVKDISIEAMAGVKAAKIFSCNTCLAWEGCRGTVVGHLWWLVMCFGTHRN